MVWWTQREKKTIYYLPLKLKFLYWTMVCMGILEGRKEERSRGTEDWQIGSLDFWWSVYSFSTSFFLVYRLSSFFSLHSATMCRHNCPSLWNIMELLLLLQPKQSNNACTDTITVTQVWLWKFQIKGNTLCPQNLQVKTLLQMYTSFTCRVYNEILL